MSKVGTSIWDGTVRTVTAIMLSSYRVLLLMIGLA